MDINNYNKNANPLDTLIDFALESGAGAFWVNNAKDELKRLRQIMSKPCLEYDLMKSDTIINKCKDTIYAQHLYAALCNNVFIKDNHQWTCSWRMSGGIVADLRNCGEDYIDWYCSGISDHPELMSEGCVSNEIREDLLSLGWTIEPYDCVENNIENI